MATKQELIARLEALLAQEDAEQHSDAVDDIKEAYEALVSAAHQAAASETPTESAETTEGAATPDAPIEHLPIENAQLQDEEDKRFKFLLDSFNQKVNDAHRRRQKVEADNLAAKQAIMDELKSLISGEENIGNAFNRFNELGEKWKTIGPVPQQNYRELQTDYGHLRDEFFYHIRIYKELRDHDLKKNTALKRALIADMEAVQRVETVREAEVLVREYQEKWHQIGAVVKEEWESIRDGFGTATRVVYDRINEYYKARRAEHEVNLEAKRTLVEKMQAFNATLAEPGNKDWKVLTDQVLEYQGAWKNIGFATKKDNEKVWREFRDLCNVFFDAKKKHYDTLRDQYKAARDKKNTLVHQAEALKESTEWRQTADKLKELQAQWKSAGSAGPRDENKLWQRFREACDGFFQNRKATFEKQDAEQAVNEQAKEALIAEITSFALTGDRNKDIETLKTFSVRWMESGRVSPKKFDAFVARYRAALDKQYDALKMQGDERVRMRFQSHIEDLKTSEDPKFRLEKEGRFIKRKIEEVEGEMNMMERNMGMFNFKSKSGEEMKKEMEKKIDRAKQDVVRLRQQLKQLTIELRAPVEAPVTAPAAAEGSTEQ